MSVPQTTIPQMTFPQMTIPQNGENNFSPNYDFSSKWNEVAADSWDPTMLGLLFRPTRGPLVPTARRRC
jgi:hypothetical protein